MKDEENLEEPKTAYEWYKKQAKYKDPKMKVSDEIQFEDLLRNAKIDYKERKVNAPSNKKLAIKIANEQFDRAHGEYIYSKKQGKALQNTIYEMEGKKVAIKDIRKKKNIPKEFWDYIEEEYGRLKRGGKNGKDAKEQIGISFFNSPDSKK